MLSIFLIALSLSLDAFCLSVTNGLVVRGFRLRQALLMAAYFGAFQFLMPLIGSSLAGSVSEKIGRFAPFISFFLLAFIGARMIIGAPKASGDGETPPDGVSLSHPKLLAMAVATSIDALAVGVTFAFMDLALVPSCAVIGAVTFAVCVPGGMFGRLIPVKSGMVAEIIGGCVLVGIGIRILIDGLM